MTAFLDRAADFVTDLIRYLIPSCAENGIFLFVVLRTRYGAFSGVVHRTRYGAFSLFFTGSYFSEHAGPQVA